MNMRKKNHCQDPQEVKNVHSSFIHIRPNQNQANLKKFTELLQDSSKCKIYVVHLNLLVYYRYMVAEKMPGYSKIKRKRMKNLFDSGISIKNHLQRQRYSERERERKWFKHERIWQQIKKLVASYMYICMYVNVIYLQRSITK